MDRSRSWSLAAEGTVIVVSILIAFGLEAAWEQYKDERREQEYLASLLADFTESRKRLDLPIGGIEYQLEFASRVIKGDQVSNQEFEDEIFMFWGLPEFQPRTTSLDELIYTGEIALIEDQQLRTELLSWESNLEAYRLRERFISENFYRFAIPYLLQNHELSRIVHRFDDDITKPEGTAEYAQVIGDSYHQNMVILRKFYNQQVLEDLNRLREQCDSIVSRIKDLQGGA
ncbi:MAG: hypothetical protein MI725_04060 [Pirellulales bacterium]|nr:hypothetical protein [Pirellulales bacterium]